MKETKKENITHKHLAIKKTIGWVLMAFIITLLPFKTNAQSFLGQVIGPPNGQVGDTLTFCYVGPCDTTGSNLTWLNEMGSFTILERVGNCVRILLTGTGSNEILLGAGINDPFCGVGIIYSDTTVACYSPGFTGPSEVCSGESAVYTSMAGSGSTINWSTSSGITINGSSTASTVNVTVNDSGYIYVEVTDSLCSTSDSFFVNELPLPPLPTAMGAARCGPGSVNLTASGLPGSTFEWYDNTQTTLLFTGTPFNTPSLSSTTQYYVRQVDANGCRGPFQLVSATINPIPPAPGASNVNFCAPARVTLSTPSSGATYNWYNGNGTVLLQSSGSSSYTTDTLYNTTTFLVTAVNASGCESNADTARAIAVNPPPPTASGDTLCGPGATTLTATGSSPFRWYTSDTSGTPVAVSSTYNTPFLSSTDTFYVTGEGGVFGCESPRLPVIVFVQPTPAQPTNIISDTLCGPGSATLSASAGSNSVIWYDSALAGNTVHSGPTFNTPVLSSSTTYYVSARDNIGCESNRVPVTAVINPIPPTPIVQSNVSACDQDTATIIAIPQGGGVQTSIFGPGIGGPFLANDSIRFFATTSATYEASQVDTNGCESPRATISLTVLPLAGPPIVIDDTICMPDSVTLMAMPASGNSLEWYDAPGGNLVVAGVNAYRNYYSQTTTLYVVEIPGDPSAFCPSDTTPITVHVGGKDTIYSSADTGICAPGTITVNVSASDGVINWYSDPGRTNLVNTGSSYTANITSTSTVYLELVDSLNCVSPEDSINLYLWTPPTASFTADTLQGCDQLTVQFTNQSTIGSAAFATGPQGLRWFFGDGGSSPVSSPSHTYTSPGSFNARLIVRDTNGCFDDTIQVITVNESPQAGYAVSDTGLCLGLSVSLTDLSTTSGTAVSTWSWDFGNGSTDTIQNPSYVYPAAGNYPITLIITDVNGCSDTTFSSTVAVIDTPRAQFVPSPQNGCAPVLTTFSNTSVVPNAGSSIYQWAFGNGNNSSDSIPVTQSYTNPGVYPVRLVVTDTQYGCVDTSILQVEAFASPTADFSVLTAFQCNNRVVSFSDLSSSNVMNWNWQFGDGDSSALANPSHTYTAPGTYTISLTVVDSNGCSDDSVASGIIAIADDPVAAFGLSDTSGCDTLNVVFSDSSTIPSLGTTTWAWAFGDGGTSNQQNPGYTYQNSGTYNVNLIVTDTASGCADTTQSPVAIQVYTSPNVNFSLSSQQACANVPIQFTDNSTGGISSWNWQFGDGDSSQVSNPLHSYASGGNYFVSLSIVDTNGCFASGSLINPILIYDVPAAAANTSTFEGCENTTVFFQDNSIVYDSLNTVWQWALGDGAASSLPSFGYAYSSSGTYIPSLILVDTITGCADTLQLQPIVIYPNPTTALSAINSRVCINEPVQFIGVSTGNITSWSWNFGDNTTGSGAQPSHTYSSGGSYPVVLIVTDSNNCTDSVNSQAVIEVSEPFAAFSGDVTQGCAPLMVSFSDASIPSFGGPISTLIWDFGDGNTGSGTPVMNLYTSPGAYTVGLIIADSIGCRDTTVFPAFINTADPGSNQLYHVSVEGDSVNRLTYSRFEGVAFGSYVVSRETSPGSGVFTQVYSTLDINDTIFIDSGVATLSSSHCYRVEVLDTCGRSVNSRTHCSVELQAASLPLQRQVLIEWNDYQGWDVVSAYQVYRVNSYDTNGIVLLGTVSAGTTQFLDSSISCDSLGCYRIRAIGTGVNEIAWSDTACAVRVCYDKVPNTITPNGDGWNDNFVLDKPVEEIQIFNRWGNKVYGSKPYQNDWRGTNSQNGKELPAGVYFYVVTYEGGEKASGYVQIIRE